MIKYKCSFSGWIVYFLQDVIVIALLTYYNYYFFAKEGDFISSSLLVVVAFILLVFLAYIIYYRTCLIYLSDEYLEYHYIFASKKISLGDIYLINNQYLSGRVIIEYGDKKTINLRHCLFTPKGLQNELMSRFNTSHVENYMFVKKHHVKLKEKMFPMKNN